MKRLLLFVMLLVPLFAVAQEDEKGEFYGTVDFGYRCMWRGIENGTAPSVMPTVGYSKGGFDIYVWGGFAFDDSYREFDLAVSYSFGNFSLELVDYFYPYKGNKFFEFNNKTTTHSAELIGTYEFEKVPLYITAGTFIFGDDKKEDGKNAYSTYAEVGYTHEFNEKNSIAGVVGASFNKSMYNGYEKNFSLANITAAYTRIFSFWNFEEFPVTASYTYNPYLEKSYFNIMFTVGL